MDLNIWGTIKSEMVHHGMFPRYIFTRIIQLNFIHIKVRIYGYKTGQTLKWVNIALFRLIRMKIAKHSLFGKKKSDFEGLLAKRVFNIFWLSKQNGVPEALFW